MDWYKLKYYGDILAICMVFFTAYFTILFVFRGQPILAAMQFGVMWLNLHQVLHNNEVFPILIEKWFPKK